MGNFVHHKNIEKILNGKFSMLEWHFVTLSLKPIITNCIETLAFTILSKTWPDCGNHFYKLKSGVVEFLTPKLESRMADFAECLVGTDGRSYSNPIMNLLQLL